MALTIGKAARRQEGSRIAGIACAMALMGVLGLSACSASGTASTLSGEVDGESATATVTAVDGDTVTLVVMDGEQPDGDGQPADAGGEPPEMPSGDAGDSSGAAADAPASGSASDGSAAEEPPAKPEGDAGDGSSATPPEKPDGDSGQAPSGNPPDKPDGDAGEGAGQPGGTEMTLVIGDEGIIYKGGNDEETQGSLADIQEGSMLELSVEDGSTVTKIVVRDEAGQPGGSQPGGNGGASGEVSNGTGATTFDADADTSGESYESTDSDENALRVQNGANVAIEDATVTKTGDSSSSEDSDFYGLNAGVLAYDGSKLTVSGGTVSTDSSGSNGIFSYGEGTEVNVSDTVIRTTEGNSGGIEVAGGATLTAQDLDIDTQGESSAAIRSDRGGGTETVTGGTYATHGGHSPAVYSTADVTVNDATLTSENCEGVVIEGKNSVTLNGCDVTGNVNGVATRTDVVNNVMIYQSMSGDASEGTGSFSMKGGTFKASHGYLFYVTNTDATVSLEDVEISNAEGQLLMVAGNDGQWGNEGSNGGTVAFTATDQELSGSIVVDDISSLSLSLSNSAYTGSINADGAAGQVDVTLEDGATWTLDGDSYVSSLSGDTSGINLNGHTLFVNGEAWSA